jgi:hypothetical protein
MIWMLAALIGLPDADDDVPPDDPLAAEVLAPPPAEVLEPPPDELLDPHPAAANATITATGTQVFLSDNRRTYYLSSVGIRNDLRTSIVQCCLGVFGCKNLATHHLP